MNLNELAAIVTYDLGQIQNMKKLLTLFFWAAAGQLFAQSAVKEKTVLLDYYFNNEWKDSAGIRIRFHYTWEDKKNTGFSILGSVFTENGVQIKHLESAPTKKNLKQADIYLIVDPDTEKETEKPNPITTATADIIAKWVKSGGVLVLMGNDANNAELKNFNILASRFGIRFNEDNFNQVADNQYEQAGIAIPEGHPIFKTTKKIFVKELSTLQVSKPAIAVLTKDGKNIMATARYGKGTVFVIGDPWLYNEYTNGRLPAGFDNRKAAQEWIQWLVKQTDKN